MTKRKKKTFWIITLKIRFLGTCNIQICTDYICSKAHFLTLGYTSCKVDNFLLLLLWIFRSLRDHNSKSSNSVEQNPKCNNTVWTYFNSSACLLFTVNKKFLVLCNGLPAYIKLWSKNVWQSLHANTDAKKNNQKNTQKKSYVSNCGATVVHT